MDVFLGDVFEDVMLDLSMDKMDLLKSSMQETGQSNILCGDWHGLEYYNNEVYDLIGIEGNTENVQFFNEKHFLHSDSTEEDELMYTLVNPIKNAPQNTDSQMDSSGEIQNVLEKEAADDMSDVSNFSDTSSDSGVELNETPPKIPSDTLFEKPIEKTTTIIWPFKIVPKTTKDVTSIIGQKKVHVSVLRNNSATKNVSKSKQFNVSLKKEKITSIELNRDERRLYRQEGIKLPQKFPLSRIDEQNLKHVRRKLKNRVSAQDSRKRKKIYLEELEAKVKAFSVENSKLLKKIEQLETQNRKFANQNQLIGFHEIKLS